MFLDLQIVWKIQVDGFFQGFNRTPGGDAAEELEGPLLARERLPGARGRWPPTLGIGDGGGTVRWQACPTGIGQIKPARGARHEVL